MISADKVPVTDKLILTNLKGICEDVFRQKLDMAIGHHNYAVEKFSDPNSRAIIQLQGQAGNFVIKINHQFVFDPSRIGINGVPMILLYKLTSNFSLLRPGCRYGFCDWKYQLK